jgi:hypothetical protein
LVLYFYWLSASPKGDFVKYLFVSLFATACLMAADVTGHWAGTMTLTAPSGTAAQPAHLVLKQEGTKISGNAGPQMDALRTIQNGKIENGVLTFDVQGTSAVMSFKLKLIGEEIKGDISRVVDGQTQTAKLAVKRQK